MNAQEQVKKLAEFVEDTSKAQLMEAASKGLVHINVDFSELSKFDPELAEELLNNPEDILKAAELAVAQIDLPSDWKIKIRFKGLPESNRIIIRNIRSEHLGKFLCVDGVVRRKSDVRPQVTSSKFECPSCGQVMAVLQVDQSFREPMKCSCGRKGKFNLLSKELVDAQSMVLEEAAETLTGGEQPKKINIFLKEDLVSPITEKKTNPGSRISVNGILKEVPIILRSGGKSTMFDYIIEANSVETLEADFYDIQITKEDEEKIQTLAKDPKIYEKLIESIAPSIFGYEKEKEALVLQLMGGVQKKRKDDVTSRGDIHIMLVGDPGAGKSQILKRISRIAPKGRYISGKSVTGTGMTAAVVRDELLGGWSLEAGALVLANNGVCCTTGDAEFITENFEKVKFEELFINADSDIIYPKFKVLALNIETKKVEPFKIKKAFRIKNNKMIYSIKTRTGRELKLTEDNEVLTVKGSEFIWKTIDTLKKGDFLAVPRNYTSQLKDSYDERYSYLCGLIATGGHIGIDKRHPHTSIYNTNEQLITMAGRLLTELGHTHNIRIQKSGRTHITGGKQATSKKALALHVKTKEFANILIDFGVPSGNKSKISHLNKKIFSYSNKTICSFVAGAFDGDGSLRLNPIEATINTKIKQNARLFQQLYLRLGILSSVEKTTNSWHCTIRGHDQVRLFLEKIPFRHPEKIRKSSLISSKEVKNRIDILPNHDDFFKKLISSKIAKLRTPLFRYIWNYSKPGRSPSTEKPRKLNLLLKNGELESKISGDILWDKIVAIEETDEEWVYDFTMDGTNNFVANDIIMHNCIDELDKMSDEDSGALHEAMEQQTLSVSKANIHATLLTRTTVLVAANPKYGRFDPYGVLAEQIDMPPTLINRFDLIFPIKDMPNPTKDEKTAKHILFLHQSPDMMEAEITTDFLKKYIAYARQRVFPVLTDAALNEIKDFYVQMRSLGMTDQMGVTVKDERAIRAIPISARQLEALIRLSEASARVRLENKVTKADARRAIELLTFCLLQVGLDRKTGQIDIDRISTGISASERSKIYSIKEIIKELEGKIGKTIPIEDILKVATERGISDSEVEQLLEKLKREGDLYEPRYGFISRM